MPTRSTLASRGTGLCLLSIGQFSVFATSRLPLTYSITDAGGPRSISQLTILSQLMHRLNYDGDNDTMDRPCRAFEMITGVGSGG